MGVTQEEVARHRERLLAEIYQHFYWPLPKPFDAEDGRFGKVAVAMMRRVNKKLLPDRDPDVWSKALTREILKRVRDEPTVTPLAVAARFIGPIETLGNNLGPKVREVQLATDLAPGNWPYCAAGLYFCLKEAGWDEANQFRLGELEAWVPAWVEEARKGRYGMRVVPTHLAQPNDAVAFDWSGFGGRPVNYDHIGFVRSRPRFGMIATREFNTGPGAGGNQSDGDGCWDRNRPINNGLVVIRFSEEW